MIAWHETVELGDGRVAFNVFFGKDKNNPHSKVCGAPAYGPYAKALADFEGKHRAEYYNRFVNIEWLIVAEQDDIIKL